MQPQGYNDPFHGLPRHILLENGSDFGKRDAAAGEDAPQLRDFKGALSGHG